MSSMYRENQELFDLLEAVCEDRLSPADSARLEEILAGDRDARRLYRAYLNLHGQLYWDTAIGADSTELPVYRPAIKAGNASQESVPRTSRRRSVRRWAGAVTVAAVVLAAVWFLNRPDSTGSGNLADGNGTETQSGVAGNNRRTTPRQKPDLPLVSANRNVSPHNDGPETVTPSVAKSNEVPAPITHGSSDETILAFVNDDLQSSWKTAGIEPSPPAEETEWVRRVYLDLIGRIPTPDEATAYFADNSRGKRERLVDRLMDQPEFVYNWTTIWSNLMVGRSPARDEYRIGLQKFLRDSFRENRPWDQTVAALISAEGTPKENGASGFLLAHVNNQAVPATAVTAKVFLGMQVQCTQCHDHPFPSNGAKQNEFWELNSFFKQIDRVVKRKYDTATGRMLQEVALRKKPDAGGPIFYENRSGVVHPAYPVYNGVRVDDGPDVDRRKELAALLAAGDKPQIAEAFVNRLWQHFFGYGFTNPVDDMGPHNAPSHPQLLDRLAREFVFAGYDQKRLMKWICLSDAYALSSRRIAGNESDSPELGDPPLFSRMYVKEMTAEQAYDSLLVATGALASQSGDWDRIERQRRQWLQQFVYTYGTDENDEHTAFSGTVSQALKMMNGELISEALRYDRSTVFRSILNADVSEAEKIRRLCLAALTRYPTDQEVATIRKLIARNAKSRNRREATAEGLQDAFWAYLNSSEFVLVH